MTEDANSAPVTNETERKEALEYWGELFDAEKNPTDTLQGLLGGVAKYISTNLHPNDHNDLTPIQLATFYRAVGGDYDALFSNTPPSAIAYIYQALGCMHSLQPAEEDVGFSAPTVPALKTRGFIRWQTIQLLLAPDEHVPFLQAAVHNFEIPDSNGGTFPKVLPAEVFPSTPDEDMMKWHAEVSERFRAEAEDEGCESPRATSGSNQRRQRVFEPDTSTGEDSADERAAAEYFSDPLYRDRGGRPTIVRRFSRMPARSPREFIQDRGRAVATSVRHFWNPNRHPPSRSQDRREREREREKERRRSWHDTRLYDDEDLTPTGNPPFHGARRRHRRERLVTPESSDSEPGTPRPVPTRPHHPSRQPFRRSPQSQGGLSPHRESQYQPRPSPRPSPREQQQPQSDYFPDVSYASDLDRRHSSAPQGPPDMPSFAPSTGAPFAVQVGKIAMSASSSRLHDLARPSLRGRSSGSGSGREYYSSRDRDRDRDRFRRSSIDQSRGGRHDEAPYEYDRDRERMPPPPRREETGRYRPGGRDDFERRARRSKSSEPREPRYEDERERARRGTHRYVEPNMMR